MIQSSTNQRLYISKITGAIIVILIMFSVCEAKSLNSKLHCNWSLNNLWSMFRATLNTLHCCRIKVALTPQHPYILNFVKTIKFDMLMQGAHTYLGLCTCNIYVWEQNMWFIYHMHEYKFGKGCNFSCINQSDC